MMVQVMEVCRRHGLTVCVHAENDSLIDMFTERVRGSAIRGAAALASARPPEVEEEAVARAIWFCGMTGARLHLVHLSSAEAAHRVGAARRRGLPVSGETCPQYLALDKSLLSGRNGHRWACCPVLRGETDRRGLLLALRRRWLQVIGTDHCAFTKAQKDTWKGDFTRIPYGLPGVETSLAITYSLGPARGRIGPAQWVRLHSEGPARLFGLYPRKGTIRKGSDADLVIWDPKVRRTLSARSLQTACDWSPYEGMKVRGMARQVFLRGTEIAREGKYVGPGGEGCYTARDRSS
jgi:dihydropyrimidinase